MIYTSDGRMKLVALLSWYDEPSWCLAELIASVAEAGADALVAVDGAYALFPEGRAQSPSEQAQVIQAAAQGAGLELLMHLPREVWFGNEVEKRSYAFTLGHTIARPDTDWFWILDADEVVTEAMGLRKALEETDCPTASVMMEEVVDGSRTGGVIPMRKFFRAQESGIHCEHNHFTFRTGDGQLLYEGFQTPKEDLAACEHLGFLRFDHRGGRSTAREYAAQVYYDRRKEMAAELVPG